MDVLAARPLVSMLMSIGHGIQTQAVSMEDRNTRAWGLDWGGWPEDRISLSRIPDDWRE